jgi:hypothetical protein
MGEINLDAIRGADPHAFLTPTALIDKILLKQSSWRAEPCLGRGRPLRSMSALAELACDFLQRFSRLRERLQQLPKPLPKEAAAIEWLLFH